MLTRRSLIRLAAGAPFVSAAIPARAFGSKEFWDAKPPSEWNAEEIDRMISKSPWAKEASVSYNGGPGGFGGNGGMGRRGSGSGGIGFPGGGGIGFPGGGGNRGGIGNPGGYPSGGATGPGGGGSRGGGERQRFEAIVRWESALPIQQALHADANDDKPNPDFAKYYVIGLIGDLPMVGGGRRRNDDNSDDDDDATQRERRLDMYKQYTRLERKDGPVQLEKVEDGSRTGSKGPGTYFYFSRLDDISMDDKQVSFTTKLGPMEIKAKFVLKDMLYHGKLAV